MNEPKKGEDGVQIEKNASLSPEQERILGQVKELLIGLTNWTRMLDLFKEFNPSEDQKSLLKDLVINYIEVNFKKGTFKNLKGIETVLDYLEISNLEFNPKLIADILKLYDKYPLPFLLSMSPSLYEGKLINGTPYDEVEYVKELLKKQGAVSEELTDDYIKNLWNVREILVKMHSKTAGKRENQPKPKMLDFIQYLTD